MNQLTDQVKPEYGYISGYRPKSIANQIEMITQIFDLDPSHALDHIKKLPPLPEGAEGWFAIPSWNKVAYTYSEAVKRVITLISKARDGKFNSYHFYHERLGPIYLRQHERTVAMFKKLTDQQRGQDIVVVPAQFGLRHQGHCVHGARNDFNTNEFGLGVFIAGIMLLTHPERLQRYGDLWIDCAGDEYNDPDDRDQFSQVPYFYYIAGWGAGLNTTPYTTTYGIACGAVSGFVPDTM